jgi:hypothetical protein
VDSLSPSSKALLFGYSLCSGILDCVEMEKYSRAVSQYIYILYTSLSQIYGLQILLPIWLILSLFTDLDIIFDRCKVCFWWIMILSFHFFFFFVVLRTKPRSSCMLGMYSITELLGNSDLLFLLFLEHVFNVMLKFLWLIPCHKKFLLFLSKVSSLYIHIWINNQFWINC